MGDAGGALDVGAGVGVGVGVDVGVATTAPEMDGVLDRGMMVEAGADPLMLTVIPLEGMAGACTVFEVQRTC